MAYHLHIPPSEAEALPVGMLESAIQAVHDIRAEIAKKEG
jgi:hypothetical protein